MKSRNRDGDETPSPDAGQAAARSATPEQGRGAEEVRDWLVAALSDVRGIAPADIDAREPFSSYGLGSIQAVSMIGELEEQLGRTLPPTLLWDYPTIDEVVKYLTEEPAA
jgi:acyl carrier protein